MPQMSPIWWLFIMMMNLTLMMMINNLIYFNILKIKINKKELTLSKNLWKW